MHRPSRLHLLSRALFACVALVALAAALAACGSDEETQSLTFELESSGKAGKFTVPDSADSGEAEITFVNDTDSEADMQLIRVEGDRSGEEVVKGLEAAIEGEAFPDWFFAGGGVGALKPGDETAMTQVLEPGTYYPFNTEGGEERPDPKSLATVEVTGDESDDELEADTTVTAAEYLFDAEGLTAGKTEVDFRNDGAQPHHMLIAPLVGDGTAKEAEEAFKGKGGKPPFDEKEIQGTAVIEGGESQLVELDLKKGRYLFFCFITDREGGPPHAVKGMVDEFEVQ